MFWKFHSTPSASVDELLNKEDVTLEQLLDEEDIIQECKAQNGKVIDFLTRPEMLMSLVSHMVTEPDPAADVTAQYRYANMASEIVSCNIPPIIDQLASQRDLLQQLYSILQQEAPLNPLLASFFSRTLALLIVRMPDQSWYSYQFNCLQVLEFLKSTETFIDLVLKHLGTSAIMDLACNLICGIEAPEYRQNALNWLNDQRLVQRLAELMGDSAHPERQANAAQVIMSVVTCSRQMAQQLGPGEKEPNPLVSTIETPEFVASLLDGVLGEDRTEAGLVNACQVLCLLLDTGRQSMLYQQNEEDESSPPPEPASVSAAAAALLVRLGDCHAALLAPPPRPPVLTSCGRLDPPLGATRLHLARLTAALISANRHTVNCELARLGTVDLLLDLFFQYSLNNFLHSQVEQCIRLILEAEPQENEDGKICHPLLVHIFTKTKLVQRILQGMEQPQNNGETSVQKRCSRSLRAYCGHLVNMANKICSACEEGPNGALVRAQLEALPEETRVSWQAFKEAKLNRINEQNKPLLPDTKQETSSESEYRGVSDAQQAAILRTFHNFQKLSAGLGAGVPDQFGVADDEYNDLGDALSAPPEQLTPVGLLALDMAASEQRPSAAELFEQQCAERFAETEALGQWTARRADGPEPCHSSSDEEDEADGDETTPRHISMEVDTSDPWVEAPAPVAMDTGMWGASPAAVSTGWADFGSFPSASSPPQSQPAEPAAAAPADPPHFHADFESAFSSTCALQESPRQPPSERPPPPPVEVQPEVLVAEPVLSKPDSPHELNDTGGDFTPLFYEDCSSSEGEEPESVSHPTRLADNYSYLTSQGLMNGAVDSEAAAAAGDAEPAPAVPATTEVTSSSAKAASPPESGAAEQPTV